MILLALTGCFTRYEPLRSAAQAERAEAPDAEQKWEDVLQRELVVGEWKQARRRMCALREARIAEAFAQLSPDATYDEVRGLQEDLAACPGAGELKAGLLALDEQIALVHLQAIDDDHAYARLVRAQEHARHLTPESPFWTTLEDWRTTWVDQLDRTRAEWSSPVTDAWLQDVKRDAGVPVTADFQAVGDAALARHVRSLTIETDASCADLARPPTTLSGNGFPVDLTVKLTGCTSSVTHGTVEVPYPVTKYREELQTVPVTTRYTTATTVHNVNCYMSLNLGREVCTHVGTRTEYDHEDVTTYEQRMVSVPYTVTEYRTEDRYTRTAAMGWTLTMTTEDGRRTAEARVSSRRVEAFEPTALSSWRPLADDSLEAATTRALSEALDLRLDTLVSEADTATPAGIEALLTAAAGGRTLDDAQLDALATTLGLPRDALADRPDLGDMAAVPLTTSEVAYRFPRVEQGLVRYGFSPLMWSTGFGRTTSGTFAAHEDPTAWGLHIQGAANGSLSTGLAANGLAVHAAPTWDLSYGWRSNKAHVFTELPLGRLENDREPRRFMGMQGAVGLLGGFRSTGIGVFAGVRPAAGFHMTGFVKHGYAHLPLAARLELRPVPRRPLIVSGWFGDLLTPGSTDFGARVSIPVGANFWLTGSWSRTTGRTELLGLHDQDRLDGGRQVLEQSWVGYSFGF